MDGIIGEELFELAVELRGQGFVVGDDEGWLLHRLDDFGDGKGLPAPSDPHQGLGPHPLIDPPGKLFDGLWLISPGLKIRNDPKLSHGAAPPFLGDIIPYRGDGCFPQVCP